MNKVFKYKNITYEINYDEEKLMMLYKEIVRECSVRKNTRCEGYARFENDLKFIENINGDRMYENISDIRISQYGLGYWNIKFKFNADKIINPYLAIFLECLLDNEFNIKYTDYFRFINKFDLIKKDKVKSAIDKLNKDISEVSNFNFVKKKIMIYELERLVNIYKNIPDFDLEKISKYYDKAYELISVKKNKNYQKSLKPNK